MKAEKLKELGYTGSCDDNSAILRWFRDVKGIPCWVAGMSARNQSLVYLGEYLQSNKMVAIATDWKEVYEEAEEALAYDLIFNYDYGDTN